MPSIGKVLSFLLYPVLGVVAGWAFLPVGRSATGIVERGRDGTSRTLDTRTAKDASTPWTAEEFMKAMAAHQEAQGNHGSPVDKTFAGWTDVEILAALEEAAHDPEERLRLLETAEPTTATLKTLETHLPGDNEVGQFRTTLVEWGADAARADTIIRRIENSIAR